MPAGNGKSKLQTLKLRAATIQDAQQWWTAIGLALHAAYHEDDTPPSAAASAHTPPESPPLSSIWSRSTSVKSSGTLLCAR